MPSWASLLTSTASARYPLCLSLLPALRVVLGGPQAPSLLIVSEHGRSFVFKVLIKELSIRSIMIRWFDPFPWYDARKSYAYASGTVEPTRRGAAGEFLAQIRGEMVAILGEEVVGGAHELLRRLVYYRV